MLSRYRRVGSVVSGQESVTESHTNTHTHRFPYFLTQSELSALIIILYSLYMSIFYIFNCVCVCGGCCSYFILSHFILLTCPETADGNYPLSII